MFSDRRNLEKDVTETENRIAEDSSGRRMVAAG
jgi:hypothetical protein